MDHVVQVTAVKVRVRVAGHDVSVSLLLSSSEKENELEKGAEHDQSIQRMHAGDSDH